MKDLTWTKTNDYCYELTMENNRFVSRVVGVVYGRVSEEQEDKIRFDFYNKTSEHHVCLRHLTFDYDGDVMAGDYDCAILEHIALALAEDSDRINQMMWKLKG